MCEVSGHLMSRDDRSGAFHNASCLSIYMTQKTSLTAIRREEKDEILREVISSPASKIRRNGRSQIQIWVT